MNQNVSPGGPGDDAMANRPPSRMGRPSREVAGALSPKILDAALTLVCEGGYDTITMSEVALRAGVSKRTLYTRFDDKDDLVASMIHYALERHVWDSGRRHGGGDVETRIFRALQSLLTSTLKPEILAIERLVLARPDYERHPSILATRMVPVQILRELLNEAKETGKATFKDVAITAYTLLDAMVLGPRIRYLKLTESERRLNPLDAQLTEIFETLWAGLCPRR